MIVIMGLWEAQMRRVVQNHALLLNGHNRRTEVLEQLPSCKYLYFTFLDISQFFINCH